jgi:thioredoxin reductase
LKRTPIVNIISGGISGPSAGIYARMNGIEPIFLRKTAIQGVYAKVGSEMDTTLMVPKT